MQVGATADADPLAVIWGKAVKGERKKEKWIKGKERAGKNGYDIGKRWEGNLKGKK